MTSCHSVLNFGAFLRHSTCPNFDWNIFETTLKPPGMFHHPNSPVISPDKAGTPFFFLPSFADSSKGSNVEIPQRPREIKRVPVMKSRCLPMFWHMKSWERNMENQAKSGKVWVEITFPYDQHVQAMMLANWHQHWMNVSLQASVNQWTWRKVNNANMPTWNIRHNDAPQRNLGFPPPTIQQSLHVDGCATKMRIHSQL